MKLRRACFVVVVSCSASCADAGEDGGGTGTTEPPSTDSADETTMETATDGSAAVTFHRDVRPVLERHCVGCHRAGDIAPFELITYADAFAYRETMVASVTAGTMPPWGMDAACNTFSGDLSLPPEDAEVFAAWVAAGAPEGNPADFVAREPLTQPVLSRTDLTLELPEPYEPMISPDDYRCFLLDWPETETTFVTGFQFEPDNRSITHHVIVYVIAPDEVAAYDQLDADDPGPGYTCFGGPGGGGINDFISSRWLGAWAPGTVVGDLPEGTGLRIEPGSKVAVQMHYNTLAANGMPDQSRVHYKLDASVEREAFMLPWADPGWLAGGMDIPARTDDTVHSFILDPSVVIDLLTDVIPAGEPIDLFSSIHHMHRRGSRGEQSILRADGTEQCLLDVPRYDYNWQMSFRYADPMRIEPGDQLRVECQWDNLDNDQPLNWGDGTGDEMCLGIFYVAPAK